MIYPHKDWYVDFETAKLAKQKGFDLWEYCDRGYNPNTGSVFVESWPAIRRNLNELLGCPHKWLLQKWLLDVHNKHIIILRARREEEKGFTFAIDTMDSFCWDVFPTYEEALEHGLLHALNLI